MCIACFYHVELTFILYMVCSLVDWPVDYFRKTNSCTERILLVTNVKAILQIIQHNFYKCLFQNYI